MGRNSETILRNVEETEKNEVDLDEALNIAGFGRYNLMYSLGWSLFLIAVIVEPVGYSFVLPSAKCDLDMSDTVRGFIGSIPYIGIVLTSFPWGYLVDTQGRKKMVIYSSLAVGVFSALSAFMPELISFIIFKFLSSLCLACPAAAPYTFIAEILPLKYRDLMLSVTNAMQILGSVLVPLFAWAVLPLDFSADFGSYYFRPWRLLTILYASIFIVSAILLSFGPESPKYLISQGKHDESLEVLRKIYAGNSGNPPEDYPVRRLKIPDERDRQIPFLKTLRVQSVPLLKPPYVKWMCLNSVLFFGLFATLNGLYIWLPDVLNQVLTGDVEDVIACDIISERFNGSDTSEVCIDSLDPMIFQINSIANFSCAIVALALSATVKFIGKKVLLVFVYWTIGIFIILLNVIKHDIVFAVLMSSIRVMGVIIGPINAYSVEIFPTTLRGMAIGLTMMAGRAGSVVGTNVAGALLNVACEATFYSFGGSLILCGLLVLLLPRSKRDPNNLLKSADKQDNSVISNEGQKLPENERI